jgi:RNA polymerase sigma-70 factor (ECF subfamily)
MAQSNQFTELNQRVAEEIPGLLRFAVKLTGDIHSAEDVVQEALLRAARSISTFRREASFRTWLMQIVLNVFRTHAGRRRPLEQPLEAAAHASSQATVQQDLEAAETRDHVATLVGQLPARQREVLVLMTWENCSAEEVATMLGISVQNVYSNLSAARSNLKQNLIRAEQ